MSEVMALFAEFKKVKYNCDLWISRPENSDAAFINPYVDKTGVPYWKIYLRPGSEHAHVAAVKFTWSLRGTTSTNNREEEQHQEQDADMPTLHPSLDRTDVVIMSVAATHNHRVNQTVIYSYSNRNLADIPLFTFGPRAARFFTSQAGTPDLQLISFITSSNVIPDATDIIIPG